MSRSDSNDGGVRRRTLLKAGGAVATLGLTGMGVSAVGDEVKATNGVDDEREVVHSNCWICRESCGQEVTIEKGRAVDLTGVDGHPKASGGEGREGTLCSKGMGQLDKTYHPDRITQPYIREDENLRAVSWDEAIEYTANRLEEFAAQHGPEKLLRYQGYPLGKHPWHNRIFKNLYGAPIKVGRKTTCHGPVSSSWAAMSGYGREHPDWQNSKYMIAWGRNMMECFRGQWEPKGVLDAKENNDATVVCIDPRYTKTAEVADKWLPVKPRTDGALALAMANVIIEEGLYDEDFVAEWGHGFPVYREEVADKTPEWAEEITGIDAQDIREVAIGFAKAAPRCAAMTWTGIAYQANGFKNSQAIHALNGLVGNIDSFGGTRQWHKGYSLADPDEKRGIDLPSNHKGKPTPDYDDYPFQRHTRDLSHNLVPKAVERGDVRGFVTNWSQPPKSGNTRAWWEALEEMDLVITVDAFWTGVSKRADVVFPGASALEQPFKKSGGDSSYSTSGWVTASHAAIEPLTDNIKPDYQLYKDLAEEMGWGEYFPWETGEEYWDEALSGIDLNFAEVAEDSYKIVGDLPYRQYEDGGFDTVNGMFNFDLDVVDKYAGVADELGISTAPSWVPPDDEHFGETTNEDYPLLFTDTFVEQFSRGHCQAIPNAREAYAERFGQEDVDYRGNYLHINPKDAEKRDIEDGDWVRVSSRDDEIELLANVWEGTRPGRVVTENGFGEDSAHPDDEGGHSMKFNKERHVDPIVGMVSRNHPVEVERLGGGPR